VLKGVLSYQTFALRSLWNLFRGKRFNVLHRRTDSWHYEVDQLILGTLLFTLFTFSLPTLLTYALLFSLMRSGVVMTCGAMSIATDLMNQFPLFPLLLRIKDPRRLPGTVYFRMMGDTLVLEAPDRLLKSSDFIGSSYDILNCSTSTKKVSLMLDPLNTLL
ncbi:N-acetylglucosaminyl transferase component-domain-containing protein, partial [Lactarius akahatsu]